MADPRRLRSKHLRYLLYRQAGGRCAACRREMAADPKVTPLADKAGRPSKAAGNGSNTTIPSKDRGASYLVRRLKRDHPDIAAALARGEYPSARAAAIAAGLVRVPTLLELFQRLWAKASPEERAAIRKAVSP